jgi:hypothetical protein
MKNNLRMNIYDFFNSPDVAEYCRNIGHTFNAVESAVMVSQSNKRTLAEKLAAYRTIIAEYPDMELPRGNNHDYYESFHKALGKFIIHEERILEKFIKPEHDAVYLPFIDREYYRCTDIHKTYDKAINDALKSVENGKKYTVEKKYLDSDKYFEAEFSKSGEILDVSGYYTDDMLKSEKEFDILSSIYIDVPVPFKRGDLVEVDDGGYMGNVYVLLNLCRNDAEENSKRIYRSDLMDMTALVHYECGGLVECECTHFYPDLRYCRRELQGEQRILKYVSLYLQDELCICSLLKIQQYLLADKITSELKNDGELKWQLGKINGDKLLNEHELDE